MKRLRLIQPLRATQRRALTLVEMLIAMAIALLMMAAVVTVFANISDGVSRRRATIEMGGLLRSVREQLSRDLEGATCPTIPWQKPESNVGYFELIEGPMSDSVPSVWLWDSNDSDAGFPDGLSFGTVQPADRPRIDLALSQIPGSNLRGPSTPGDQEGRGLALGSNEELDDEFVTDARGLGDGDDILMFTSRNESLPFIGRVPKRIAQGPSDLVPGNEPDWRNWTREDIEAPVAEVVWFSVENPPERPGLETFHFGEPGYRNVYRRTFLVAPWLEYRIQLGGGVVTGPGIVRVLPANITRDQPQLAIAALIAFQEVYDLSVRAEWDPSLPGTNNNDGRWVLRANTLGDLTKPENRYEHHGLVFDGTDFYRQFPFAAASFGRNYSDGDSVGYVVDVAHQSDFPSRPARFAAVVQNNVAGNGVLDYQPASGQTSTELFDPNARFTTRPLAFVNRNNSLPATARAVLNEDGHVVAVRRGLVPLSGPRRGDDLMLTNALAFDLRVYDPGAPTYAYYDGGYDQTSPVPADFILEPTDPGWGAAAFLDTQAGAGNANNSALLGDLATQQDAAIPFRWQRNGAYVDLGYGRSPIVPNGNDRGLILSIQNLFERWNIIANNGGGVASGVERDPVFAAYSTFKLSNNSAAGGLGYATFDTWSFHYEHNGIDEDAPPGGGPSPTDQGTDLLDSNNTGGVDDPSERETRPPYETPLRGVEALLRVYERDSRQVREAIVRESFVAE